MEKAQTCLVEPLQCLRFPIVLPPAMERLNNLNGPTMQCFWRIIWSWLDNSFFLNQGKDLSERDNFFENEDFVNKRL